jgi:hypothetical protein
MRSLLSRWIGRVRTVFGELYLTPRGGREECSLERLAEQRMRGV